MAHAPGCGPDDYILSEAPDGFEWRSVRDVRVGDLDQFDRPVTDIVWTKNGNSVKIRCEGMVPVGQIGRTPATSRLLFRKRPEAEITVGGLTVRLVVTTEPDGTVRATLSGIDCVLDYADFGSYTLLAL